MAHLPLVSPLDRALFLKAQPYLDGLASNVLAALSSYSEESFYDAGSEIRSRQKSVERVLFLASGSVFVSGPPDAPEHGSKIEAPGAVGLAHLFAESNPIPSVRAIEDTLCLEIRSDDLAQILEDHFALLLQMARTSCEQAILATMALGANRPPEPGFSDQDQRETPVHLDLVHRLARAKRAPFLRDTNLTVLGELFRSTEPTLVPSGKELWATGDPVDRMAFVLDGELRADGSYGECTAPSGSTVGACEILAESPRFESWTATRPSRVLFIYEDVFTDLLEDHFDFALAYLKHVNHQLTRDWNLLANARARESAA